MKHIGEEFAEALFTVGITDLVSVEKFAEKIKQHFEKRGKLNELKEHISEVAKLPYYQLMEKFPVSKGNCKNKVPFYKILEQEGIILDSENFLRLNGERVAYIGEGIIPLKGKKEELKKVLEKILEIKRELSYPEEVFELPSFAKDDSWFNPETGKYVHPEEFERANKVAYEFGSFWKNISKPIRESDDPFVQTLIHLDELPEYDPGEELKQMQLVREIRKNHIKQELLKELEKTKVYSQKNWLIIPTIKVEMNPGYEEFFHAHLGDYSKEEIYATLKELEKRLTGENKLKINALKRKFEKKEGILRRKKLTLVLLGGLAAGAVSYVAYELTRDRKPPVIKDLKWVPTRIVNDKVYDINISFSALDDKSHIASAELIFKPENYSYFITKYGMRPEVYNLVFPNDTRVIQLTPIDGVFNSTDEEFLVSLKNITGGVEYKIIAKVKDSSGNEGIKEMKTSYIREFENIGKNANITITAHYYPWFSISPVRHWNEGYPPYIYPLLGEYDSGDPVVISKHIDWATGHGIKVFLIDWYGPNSPEDKNLQKILKNVLINDISIAILYPSQGRLKMHNGNFNLSDPINKETFFSDFDYLSHYFTHPSYYKINNSAYVYLFVSGQWTGDISGILNSLRNKMKEKDIRLFLVADFANWQPVDYYQLEKTRPYDAIATFSLGVPDRRLMKDLGIKEDFSNFEEIMEKKVAEWSTAFHEINKPYITSANSRYDLRYCDWGDPNSVPFLGSPERFYKTLKIVSKYSNFINVWFNEWNEGAVIEPTLQDQFNYLLALKQFLKDIQQITE
jgi:hypothetical protein